MQEVDTAGFELATLMFIAPNICSTIWLVFIAHNLGSACLFDILDG